MARGPAQHSGPVQRGLDALATWRSRGRIIPPRDPERPPFVALVQAIARQCGLPDAAMTLDPAVDDLTDLVDGSEHIVLVLIDGLGSALLDRFAQKSGPLRRHKVGELSAVIPSATSPALTSLSTGRWPTEHGVSGWWTWLEDERLTVEPLPWRRRGQRDQLSLSPDQLFTAHSLAPAITADPMTVTSSELVSTVYSGFSSGGTPIVGYQDWAHAVDTITDRIHGASSPTWTWWYLPELDRHCHHSGPRSKKTRRLMTRMESEINDLARRLDGRARILVTADHGHVDVNPDEAIVLNADDPLLALCHCPPSGEPAFPIFHVRPGVEREFEAAFEARLGEHYALIPSDVLIEQGYFGPPPPEDIRPRFGDYIAIAPTPTVLTVRQPGRRNAPLRGIHGGLTPEEVRVPLIRW